MYHVPRSYTLLVDPWSTSRRFIFTSSLVIAWISAFLMTVRYMLRYNDFDIWNGALFTLLAIYCFMLGVILSGTTEIITVFFARMSKSSVSRRRCVFIRATVVLLIIAVIGRITWYNPALGEEADALNRYIGRVIIPCFLHFVAIMWHNNRINRQHNGPPQNI